MLLNSVCLLILQKLLSKAFSSVHLKVLDFLVRALFLSQLKSHSLLLQGHYNLSHTLTAVTGTLQPFTHTDCCYRDITTFHTH